jgi:hypothetical protein
MRFVKWGAVILSLGAILAPPAVFLAFLYLPHPGTTLQQNYGRVHDGLTLEGLRAMLGQESRETTETPYRSIRVGRSGTPSKATGYLSGRTAGSPSEWVSNRTASSRNTSMKTTCRTPGGEPRWSSPECVT